MNALTRADVARLLDVKVSTVTMWRWRDVMPDPDGYLGSTPYWWPQTIERWARQTGRWRR